MKKKEKQEIVAYLHKRFEESGVMILADYRGLNVAAMNRIRLRLREQDAELRVVKNTLAKIAARGTGMSEAEGVLEGPTAIILHESDIGMLSRTLAEFAKKKDILKITGGVISGKLYDARRIQSVARLPGRMDLLAILSGTMKSGPSKLLGVVSAMPRKMAGLLLALKESRESEGTQGQAG